MSAGLPSIERVEYDAEGILPGIKLTD